MLFVDELYLSAAGRIKAGLEVTLGEGQTTVSFVLARQ